MLKPNLKFEGIRRLGLGRQLSFAKIMRVKPLYTISTLIRDYDM